MPRQFRVNKVDRLGPRGGDLSDTPTPRLLPSLCRLLWVQIAITMMAQMRNGTPSRRRDGGAGSKRFRSPCLSALGSKEKGATWGLGGGRIDGWTLGARARTRHVHIQSPEGNCVALVAIPSGGTLTILESLLPLPSLHTFAPTRDSQTARGVMSIGSFSSPELHVCRNIQAKTARVIS